MRTNTKVRTPAVYTHEGAVASKITPELQLRRSVMACLLWESNFYEDGVTIADRYSFCRTLFSSGRALISGTSGRTGVSFLPASGVIQVD